MTEATGRRPRLFTIGHSHRSREQFFSVLERSSVRLVADIRSNPASSRHPHFERAALARALEERGLVYRWFRELGGRQPGCPEEAEHTALSDPASRRYAAAMNRPGFHAACETLLGLSASAVLALLCAERDFRRCHRFLLSDKLEVMGARVVHIRDVDDAEWHVRHPDLVEEQGRLIYRKRQLELPVHSG